MSTDTTATMTDKEIEISVDVNVDDKVNETVEEAKQLIENTFANLIEKSVDDGLDKLNITLSPEIQKYFLLLCKEKPNLFGDMESSLKKIISDNKIDTKDIPELILLVNKVNKIINENKGAPAINPYELIKTLLHLTFVVYVNTNKIENEQLITDILVIIDASIELLQAEPLKKGLLSCLTSCLKL